MHIANTTHGTVPTGGMGSNPSPLFGLICGSSLEQSSKVWAEGFDWKRPGETRALPRRSLLQWVQLAVNWLWCPFKRADICARKSRAASQVDGQPCWSLGRGFATHEKHQFTKCHFGLEGGRRSMASLLPIGVVRPWSKESLLSSKACSSTWGEYSQRGT